MDTIKLHQVITKTGIISLAALALIGIIATLFGVCNVDLYLVPEFLEMIFLFVLSTLSILACFCFPVSFLMTLISIAVSLKSERKNREE